MGDTMTVETLQEIEELVGQITNAAHRPFILPILKALLNLGGRAPRRLVIEEIRRLLADQLSESKFRYLQKNNRFGWVRLELRSRGLIGGQRGTWELTEIGRKYAEAHREDSIEIPSTIPEYVADGVKWTRGLPEGITRVDIEEAIEDFEAGAEHEFAPSRYYDLIHAGKRYPPKAIMGLAARRLAGRTLAPSDFSGGQSSQCFRIFKEHGFQIELKESLLPREAPAAVWLEITFSSHLHGGAGWDFGTCLWSPSRSKDGKDWYSLMREPKKGDLVLHINDKILQGFSFVDAPCREVNEAPPDPDQWANMAPYYRVDLRGYREFTEPTPVLDFIAANKEAIAQEISTSKLHRYPFQLKDNGEVWTTTGAYLTRVTPTLYSLIVDAVQGAVETEELDDESTSSMPVTSSIDFPENAWIFQANPKVYDIRSALANLNEIVWEVNQNQKRIRAGQPVFIWESGKNGGVLASGVILNDPVVMPEDEESRKYIGLTDKFDGENLRVRISISKVLEKPISRESLLQHPTLFTLNILRAPYGTNFRIKRHEWWELDHLVQSSNKERPSRYWLIGAGNQASKWPDFCKEEIVGIGFSSKPLASLAGLSHEEITEKVGTVDGTVPSNDILALYQFASEMSIGDRLLVKKGRKDIIGLGVVMSDYFHDPARTDYTHLREVTWLRQGQWRVPEDVVLPMKTLTDVSENKELLEAVLPLLAQAELPLGGTGEAEPYTIEQAMDGLFIPEDEFRKILEGLKIKKNIILQGPPGVGKTFVARRIAYAHIEEEDPSRVASVQFHQSMCYEDFIQGWRPAEEKSFERKNGLFYEFCLKAQVDGDRPYVFIIDEINRGNLSKIFGELMMLIESDKRGPKYAMPLTYSNSSEETFYVPENVYIIGMMNTADRSLAMVDYALRRRFRFFTLRPQLDSPTFRATLESSGVEQSVIETIIQRIGELNQEISGDKKDLGRGYQIGHSFFCPNKAGFTYDFEWYTKIIETEIMPLLEEYWFDASKKVEKWREELLKK